MAQADSIPPFPVGIDRRDFANYLAGLVDGEGYFQLVVSPRKPPKRPTPFASFGICLRADDHPIVELIHSFFGCGRLNFCDGRPADIPSIRLSIQRIEHLVGVVIPHFDRYPLRAKKRRDYEIWKQGVAFLASVTRLRRLSPGHGPHSHRPVRWTPERLQHLRAIQALLREQRLFIRPDAPVPTPPSIPPPPDRGLFD